MENNPEYIIKALNKNYDVEVDVWYINNTWYLGHDNPQYITTIDFLKNDKLWCHAKNHKALIQLLKNNIHTFSHDIVNVVLTSKAIPWAFPGKEIDEFTICVMPEKTSTIYSEEELMNSYGICSDNIEFYKKLYNSKYNYLLLLILSSN